MGRASRPRVIRATRAARATRATSPAKDCSTRNGSTVRRRLHYLHESVPRECNVEFVSACLNGGLHECFPVFFFLGVDMVLTTGTVLSFWITYLLGGTQLIAGKYF